MKVQQHYEDKCATSPCAKDKVRKRLKTRLYVVAQMMVLFSTFAALYHGFKVLHPSLFHDPATTITVASVSFSKFEKMKPWNLRKAEHESCLCKGALYADCVVLSMLSLCCVICWVLGARLGDERATPTMIVLSILTVLCN